MLVEKPPIFKKTPQVKLDELFPRIGGENSKYEPSTFPVQNNQQPLSCYSESNNKKNEKNSRTGHQSSLPRRVEGQTWLLCHQIGSSLAHDEESRLETFDVLLQWTWQPEVKAEGSNNISPTNGEKEEEEVLKYERI